MGSARRPALTIADALFDRHGDAFGYDGAAYRCHVLRVISLVYMQVHVQPEFERALGVAAFYHDAGIWLDHTWDYLEPSIERAVAEVGLSAEDIALIAAIIGEHHRLRSTRHPHPIVEAFRRADMADLFHPLRAPGVNRRDYKSLVRSFPYHGFRRMLVRAWGRGLRECPWRPLPMVKW